MTAPQDPLSRRPGDEPEWYKDAVVYELHVRSFKDSNGDGVGDFRGLTNKLDYLQDLGVTAIWLLPFYPSPLRDDGYDIADYTAVHPDYGTLGQFKRFVDEAHERGLRVITELVINHTSDQHPWFQRAVKAPAGSVERDFYVWSDTPEKWPETRVIFQDFEASNWSWHGEAGAYYWHRFYAHQPDLNFDNPAVREAVTEVLDHWAALGVDGMRLDAVPYLFQRDGTNNENLPETHEYLKELRDHLDERWPGRMFLAEANQWPEDAAEYFGDGDECHMNFHFPLMPRLFMAVSQEDRFPIVDILQQTPEIPDSCQWGIFLRNHDELTLEMVTDEERDFMYRSYAHDPQMRVNMGIRRRLAPLVNGDRRLLELLYSLLFSLPGTPVLYYGDEIGMGDNIYLGDRNGVRTPMQWSPDRNAGFSDTNPQRLFLPVVIDPEYHYEAVNVEAQHNNPRSLLWWVKRMIALRKRSSVFGRGSIDLLMPDNPKVLAFVRAHEGAKVLVVVNLSRHAQSVTLDLSEHAGGHLVELFGRSVFPEITDRPYLLTLAPHQFHWFQIETVDEQPEIGDGTGGGRPAPPEVVVYGGWTALLRGRGRQRLEGILSEVLHRQRWFGGKARAVRGCSLVDHAELDGADGTDLSVLLVRVDYVEGESEEYVLPVGFADGEEAGRLEESTPRAVLAHVRGRGKGDSGILYDALVVPVAAEELHELITREGSVEAAEGGLVGRAHPALDGDRDGGADGAGGGDQVVPLSVEQSNTSVRFGERAVLKVLRRLEPGVSPDVEIGRVLTRDQRFPHVPDLLGTVDYQPSRPRAEPRTLAVLQRFLPNEGDAWKQTLGALSRYAEAVLTGPPEEVTTERGASRSLMALAGARIPDPVVDALGTYLDSVQLLGQRTARLHHVLATADAGPAFSPEPFTALYRRSLYQSLRTTLRRGLHDARRWTDRLEEEQTEALVALADREEEILRRLRRITDTDIDALRIRVHGDFHLGQVLWTGRDLVIIDFEGEPAAPLGERRIKRCALRDVAGMLRSFDYATRVALQQQEQQGTVERGGAAHEQLEAWLGFWSRWVQATYVRSYLVELEEAEEAAEVTRPLLPASSEHRQILLDAFLIEKGVYELRYELNNRPHWVGIPLEGLTQTLDAT